MAERAEPITGKILCHADEQSDTFIKAHGKRRVHGLVWKNRTASLLFEQESPHPYTHAEAAKAPMFPSSSYRLRVGYDFEAKKDFVKGRSLLGRLFREYCITSLMLASCYHVGR